MKWWPLLMAAYLALLVPARAQAQDGAGAPGVLSGLVVDAGTGQALLGVTVVLEPLPGGVLPGRGAAGSAFLQAARSATTDQAGAYRFDGLARGKYRLRAERLGYRGTTVEVELGRADSNVSLGLPVDPIALQPVTAAEKPGSLAARPPQTYRDRGLGRLLAARIRQRRYLATDVRELTRSETVEAATLGEPDIFRAIQRLPGVTTRDDYTAELWTRGATWDETRVSFDGLPLFHPMHGLGVFAGISPDAVGAASFHPGVRPASLAEGAAGALDIVSRASTADGLHGSGDLAVTSARFSLEGGLPRGGGWTLAARRSYLDLFTRSLAALTDDPALKLPYAFGDVEGRLDLGLGGGAALEASGLWEDDHVHGDVVGDATSATWGNAAGRVTLDVPVGQLRLRHTGGLTRYTADARPLAATSGLSPLAAVNPLDAATTIPTDLYLRYAFVAGELAPLAPSGDWRAGWELVSQAMSYHGPEPIYYRWLDASQMASVGAPPDAFLVPQALSYGVLWGERIWRVAPRLELESGLRLELGEAVPNGDPVRPGPRLTARWALRPGIALSAGWGRTYQYTQVLAAVGPSPHPAFNASRLFVLAGDSVPALRADVATAGGEAWLGGGWLATANGYVRRITGLVLPDPTPRIIVAAPSIVHGRNTARGMELSVRRLVGMWTASAEYGYGVSTMEAGGLRYPSPADRRHAASATVMTHLAPTIRIGAGYRFMSGAPYTRYYAAAPSCATSSCLLVQHARVGPPGGQRTPAYESVDLLAEWARAFGPAQLGVYLQLRNAFAHDNPAAYGGSIEYCTGTATDCAGAVLVGPPTTGTASRRWTVDRFEPGLPRLPIVGLRATF